MMEQPKMVATAGAEAVTETVYDVSEALYRLPVSTSVQSGGLNCTVEEEAGNAVRFSLAHFSKHYIELDASKSVDSFINGNLSADALCQGIGADVCRAMRSWTS